MNAKMVGYKLGLKLLAINRVEIVALNMIKRVKQMHKRWLK